jgi:uncharacterized membrane protein
MELENEREIQGTFLFYILFIYLFVFIEGKETNIFNINKKVLEQHNSMIR